jgi:hypothetical protein
MLNGGSEVTDASRGETSDISFHRANKPMTTRGRYRRVGLVGYPLLGYETLTMQRTCLNPLGHGNSGQASVGDRCHSPIDVPLLHSATPIEDVDPELTVHNAVALRKVNSRFTAYHTTKEWYRPVAHWVPSFRPQNRRWSTPRA